MQCFVVRSDEIEDVFSVEFYSPLFLENRKKIRSSKFELIKLQDITNKITKGETPLWKGDRYREQGVLFIKSENVLENELNLSSKTFIDGEVHERMNRSQLKKGDVLLNIVGASIGRSCVYDVEEQANINQAVCLIRLKNNINPYWLSFVLNSQPFQMLLNQTKSGGARDNIDLYQVRELRIPLAPPSIQNNIVDIMQSSYAQKKRIEAEAQRLLDSIDGYVLAELGIKLPEVEDRKCFVVWNDEVLKRLDPLYYSKDMFSFIKKLAYDVKTIEEISFYLKTGFAAGGSQQELVNEGVIQIRPTNIDDTGLLKFDKNIYIKREYLEKKKDDLLQKGEVLFNNTNSQELVGKTTFFDLEGAYFCSNHVTRIKVNEDVILPRYLCMILDIYRKAKIFFNICTNWNNQSGVNIELLKTVKVPLPPLKIQNKIAEEGKRRISEAERLKAEAGKIIAEAKKKVEGMILGD